MSRSVRVVVAILLAALSISVFVSPALAETVSVTDPNGDIPDILKLTLSNNESAVVLKQKYTDVAYVQVETLYIKWGTPTYYRINRGNYDDDSALETRFWLTTPDGDVEKKCGAMEVSRSAAKDLSSYRVPRSCLPKAPNRVFAKGVATMGLYEKDETKATPKADRG